MGQTRNEKKIANLRERVTVLTRRIKADTQEKADLEKEIERLEAAEITSFMKKNGINPTSDFMKQLALTQRLADNGYSAEDMEQLFELKDTSKTGINNAKTQEVEADEEA